MFENKRIGNRYQSIGGGGKDRPKPTDTTKKGGTTKPTKK